MLLIWSNAREYNQQGSQVYADADTLEVSLSQVSTTASHADRVLRST